MTSTTDFNPYIAGPPVSGEKFYGRDDLFDFIRDALKAADNHIILLHGQRRVGKSSVLHHLKERILPEEGHLPVLIDLQPMAHERLDQILYHVAVQIAWVIGTPEPLLTEFEGNPDHFALSFFPQVLTRLNRQRLVVLVDEFDVLGGLREEVETPQSHIARTLLAVFGQMSEKFADNLSFVLVVARQYQHLPSDMKMWLREFRARGVWLLDEKSARDLIVNPAAGQLTYQPGAINKILALTSGHPFFIQLICYEAFKLLREKGRNEVAPGDVEAVIPLALERGSASTSWIWEGLSLSGKLMLSAFSEAVDENGLATSERIHHVLNQHRVKLGSGTDPAKIATKLREERILASEADNSYKFEVEMVRRWVRHEHPIHREKQFIESLSRPALGYYEAATSNREAGKLDTAIANYRQALMHNPNHLGAQVGLAQALQEKGDLPGAVEAFEEAYWLDEISSQQGLIDSLLALADAEQREGNLAKTAQLFRQVLEVDSENQTVSGVLQAWFDDAQRAYESEEWNETISRLNYITQMSPDFKKEEVLRLLKEARQELRRPEKVSDVRRSHLWLGIAGGIILITAIVGIVLRGVIFAPPFTPTEVVVVTLTPTPTPILVAITATPSATPKDQPPSPTPTITPTPKPGEPPIPTFTSTATPTPFVIFVTATPTITPTPSSTSTPTSTSTLTPSPTPSFTPTPTRSPLPPHPAADVAVNLADPKQVLAAIPSRGIYRSDDRGYIWRKVWPVPDSKLGSEGLRAITLIPTGGPLIYAATFNGIAWSVDGGETWGESVGDFERGHLSPQTQVYTIVAAQDNPETVYAGTEHGLFIGKLRDNSFTWNIVRARGREGDMIDVGGPIYAITIDLGESLRIFAAGEGDEIYKSENGGASWEVLICNRCGSNIFALAVSNGKLYAAGGQKDGEPTVATISGNSDMWVSASQGIPTPKVPSLVVSALTIDPANSDILYAGTGFMVNDDSHGIYRSVNGGRSWQVINHGLPMAGGGENYYVQGIAINSEGTVYIAGFGGVHKSEDGGKTWIKQ
jgi:tetratricopeptide (TPR) repeat protein